jgi:hypothetical protein
MEKNGYKAKVRLKWIVVLCGVLVSCSAPLKSMALAQERISERRSLNTEGYKACTDGPQMLKLADTWERQHNKLALITINDESMTPEQAAEVFIADCSRDLSLLSGMDAASESATSFRMIRNIWAGNLEFMKWWLQNRRQKIELPLNEKQ